MKSSPTYRSLNRPLTLFGVERRMFFAIVAIAFALFQVTTALLPSVVLFIVLLTAFQQATKIDPQILRLVRESVKFASRYDPAKPERKK